MTDDADDQIEQAVAEYREWLNEQVNRLAELSRDKLYMPAGMAELRTHQHLLHDLRIVTGDRNDWRRIAHTATRGLKACVITFGKTNMPDVVGLDWDEYAPRCFCEGCLSGGDWCVTQ